MKGEPVDLLPVQRSQKAKPLAVLIHKVHVLVAHFQVAVIWCLWQGRSLCLCKRVVSSQVSWKRTSVRILLFVLAVLTHDDTGVTGPFSIQNGKWSRPSWASCSGHEWLVLA